MNRPRSIRGRARSPITAVIGLRCASASITSICLRMGRGIASHTGLLFVLALGLIAAPSVSSAGAAETIMMQSHLNDDGSGRLFVMTGVGEPWSWEACAPDLSHYAPFGTGREITTEGAGPETVFRVSGNPTAGLTLGVSPIWHGNAASVGAPSVDEPVRANELVTSVPDTWSGGERTNLTSCSCLCVPSPPARTA